VWTAEPFHDRSPAQNIHVESILPQFSLASMTGDWRVETWRPSFQVIPKALYSTPGYSYYSLYYRSTEYVVVV
jgi:hypothetical protein